MIKNNNFHKNAVLLVVRVQEKNSNPSTARDRIASGKHPVHLTLIVITIVITHPLSLSRLRFTPYQVFYHGACVAFSIVTTSHSSVKRRKLPSLIRICRSTPLVVQKYSPDGSGAFRSQSTTIQESPPRRPRISRARLIDPVSWISLWSSPRAACYVHTVGMSPIYTAYHGDFHKPDKMNGYLSLWFVRVIFWPFKVLIIQFENK